MNLKKLIFLLQYVILHGSTDLTLSLTKLIIIYVNYRIKVLTLVAHLLDLSFPHLGTKSILVPFVLHLASALQGKFTTSLAQKTFWNLSFVWGCF
jgi:hypothetical protein